MASISGTKSPLGEIEPEVTEVDPDYGSDINDNENEENTGTFDDGMSSTQEDSQDEESDNHGDSDEEDEHGSDGNGSSDDQSFTNFDLGNDYCCCSDPTTKIEALNLIDVITESDVTSNNYGCLLDNLVRSIKLIFREESGVVNSVYKVAATDLFFRFRHELLFKILCKCFNLPVKHSDTPFSDFGIDSNRTPDLIFNHNGVLLIIEVTATSSIEKAAINKGMDEMGFESKYKREIDLLNDSGVSNQYLPVFFDMSDTEKPFLHEQIQSISKFLKINPTYHVLLKLVSSSLSIITNNMKNFLINSASILFTRHEKIISNHKNHEFLYGKSKPNELHGYRQFRVSPNVYNKISNNWERLFWHIDNSSFSDRDKVCFIIDSNTHRLHLDKNSNGVTLNELRNFIEDNNKIELFKFVKIKTGNIYIDSGGSETGVQFFEKIRILTHNEGVSLGYPQIPLIEQHVCVTPPPQINNIDFSKYESKVQQYTSEEMYSNHYDPCYEDKMINAIKDIDNCHDYKTCFNKLNLLGNMESSRIDINTFMQDISQDYITVNTPKDNIPITKLKMKSPFILPICEVNESSYCELKYKNSIWIESIISRIEDSNPYTSAILNNVNSPLFQLHGKPKIASLLYRDLINRRFNISNKINQLQKKLIRDPGNDSSKRISKTDNPEYKLEFENLRNDYKQINKEIRLRQKVEDIPREISFVRLPTKGRDSTLRGMYQMEMKHYKDKKKQSTIEGVGLRTTLKHDFDNDCQVFNNISTLMTINCGTNPDILIDNYVAPDAKLLKDLKEIAMAEYNNLLTTVKNSYLGHASAFISRMAHSLMYYSQLPFSSDYIRVDNLGYKNILMIVKGGKKIFKTKASKFFRLIYPISEELIPWYEAGHLDKGSTLIMKNINGLNYIITPWTQLHESILTDSISFYPRVCSFTCLNLNPKLNLDDQFSKISLNVLLAFHNRRQTEVLLANLRYILLSTLGDFTGVTEILPEFFGFNYDCFQAYIRGCILFNYQNYFNNLKSLKEGKGHVNKELNVNDFLNARLKNIFTGSNLDNIEDLALMIYSTFLMTKAPYQRAAERARNLRGILKIHELYDNSLCLSSTPQEQLQKISVTCDDGDYIKYSEGLFKNDFNFDPKYCANLGVFADCIYQQQGDLEDINSEWIRIMNQTWDELATSTGLRGNYSEVEDFWGKKGYFVVYKHLLSDPGFTDGLLSIFNSDMTNDRKRKTLRALNVVSIDNLNSEREFLIFHAVDKVQWRGGREIYVMDMVTKTLQQPIEKFMAVLCKKLDNELISISSDRRSQVIHHAIFEKDLPLKDMLTWYLTLDCSKWAPKSIFVKFAITLLNMYNIPQSFKIHFLNYIEKLYRKKIFFNTAEVLTLKNNAQYSELCNKYLKFDRVLKGYYMEMPYSWVMGIFNYTSSFLHALNQKYFSYILMKTSVLNKKEESSIVMFAHSDDSGGRLSVSSFEMAQRALVLYEINLKACNHLLSKKKSVVSRIYFEILSVIYLFKKLLALLPKFLGGLRFLPTDKGPAQDMLQSYSKCIEVMVAGANFNIAYIVLKIFSMMIWRFYYNRVPTADDYLRPVQYLGLPDSHPLMALLCGSDSDLLRLIHSNVDLSPMVCFVKSMTQTIDDAGPIKPLKFEIKVRGLSKDFDDYIEVFKPYMDSWSIRNVNYHTSGLNTISFLMKLNDSGFVGSLVNESTVRRMSRSYFLRSGLSTKTNMGNVKLSTILDSLILFQSFNEKNNALNLLFEEIMSESEITEILSDIGKLKPSVDYQMELLKKTLQSPLKLYKYLDLLSMKDRKYNHVYRTLKPTQVQLVKSARVFTTNFDPATLVSYLKEPEMRWALSDARGLNTAQYELMNFVNSLGYDIEKVEPDTLLRVCRTYGRENTKNIYLYSRVPAEIRQIKSYSAFLTFISVNTFDDKEIAGLTLKIPDKEVSREYLPVNVNEDIYLINNIISLIIVLIEKCDTEFIKEVTIKKLEEIMWQGGKIPDFLKHILDLQDSDLHIVFLKPQIYYCLYKLGGSSNAGLLNECAYYTFLKSQRLKSGWYGKGELYIKIENNFYSFIINNTQILEVLTNKVGKLPQHHCSFILDVFNEVNVDVKSIKRLKKKNNLQTFGFDNSGELTVMPDKEIEFGLKTTIIDKRNEFVDSLFNYEFNNLTLNSLYIESQSEMRATVLKKVYTLPVKRAEITTIIPLVLEPSEFDQKLQTMGLNDFEDFILTEILTEYGTGTYIDFNELIDNYQASRLYQIYKFSFDNNITTIPRKFHNTILPAQDGSFLRIIIDYCNYTKEKIFKMPSELNPTMMRLRSEYPEQMSVILSEKLVEHYDKMYSKTEQKEISDNYHNLYNEDPKKARESLIKLMTHWGYGSLVNSIQSFTLIRENKNYLYFNTRLKKPDAINIYSDVYVFIIKSINKCVNTWKPIWKGLDTPIHKLHTATNIDTLMQEYIINICLGAYSYKMTSIRPSFVEICFINCLMGFLKEEEFVADLQAELSKNYILGSIPINYNNKGNFVVLLNTLKDVWLCKNKINFELDYNVKLQRLPDNVLHYKSLIKQFEIETPPSLTYYHGFLKPEIISYIQNKNSFKIKGDEFRISNKLVKPSNVEVPLNPLIKYLRPLRDDIFDDESWQEMNGELIFDDIDEDTVMEMWEEVEKPYKPKNTKWLKNTKSGKVLMATLNWLINPNKENSSTMAPYYRQVGENFCVLTNTILLDFKKYFPNAGARIVNFSRVLKMKTPTYLIYYSVVNELNKPEIIQEMFGGHQFDINIDQLKHLNFGEIRDSDGLIKNVQDLGSEITLQQLFEGRKIIEVDGVTVIKNIDEGGDPEGEPESSNYVKNEHDEMGEKYSKVQKKIEELSKQKGLSVKSMNKLKEKHLKKSVNEGVTLKHILATIVTETDMVSLNESIIKGTADISAEDQKSMMLAPKNFGVSFGLSKPNNKALKDNKLRAELESFHSDIVAGLVSCSIKMSKKMQKYLIANYKLWLNMVKNGKHKIENKTFLLTIILSLCNTAKVVDESGDDHIWQELMNKTSVYIADQGPESDEDDELLDLLFNVTSSSRLKYKPYGMA